MKLEPQIYFRVPVSTAAFTRRTFGWQWRPAAARPEQLSFDFVFEKVPGHPVQLEFRFPGTGEQQQTGENQ